MQQRQLRLGDILDDYCPRERRITNHAIVALVGQEVRQTRCVTCEAEHEYKQAKIPPQRKKKPAGGALYQDVLNGLSTRVVAQPLPWRSPKTTMSRLPTLRRNTPSPRRWRRRRRQRPRPKRMKDRCIDR